jgi:tetratricopeptide (TPR) repeat protein
MRNIILIAVLLATVLTTRAQNADTLYLQGNAKAAESRFEEAIQLFTMTLALQPDNTYAMYNRGICKSKLRNYEGALSDFDEVIIMSPTYKKGWLNRSLARKHLTDYDGAMADINRAIALDPAYAEAYYNRGTLYAMLSKRELSCADYKKAKELGLPAATRKVELCQEQDGSDTDSHTILRLTRKAPDKKYGFTEGQPVMAGRGLEGGPANQRAYLELLRDAQGKPVNYERVSSCCPYNSKHGLIGGMGMLDKYEISYQDEKGRPQKAIVYISFYDYEDPQILYGFKTVGQK